MAALAQLQKQHSDFAAALFYDYQLNDQFVQLHIVQDATNPDFVVNFLTTYFKESERMLNEMHVALENPVVDYKIVRQLAHKLRGSSASVGAFRVTETCSAFRGLIDLQNLQGLKQCLYRAHYENKTLKKHLEVLFKLEKKIKEAGGTVPPLNSEPPRPDPAADQAQPDTGSGAASSSGNNAPSLGNAGQSSRT
uniref:Histidine-containing phosphotransfer protein n=2 Tax=Kalanchoe fedtschenkoi TaxID=63787 RepID=A0A7N0TBG5_KALFE